MYSSRIEATEMTTQFTPDLIPLAGRDVYLMTFRARGAAGYVCLGHAVPQGTFYSKRVGDVEYSIEVAYAADDIGTPIAPSDNYEQAKFIYFQITPIHGEGNSGHFNELQAALKLQLELLLRDDALPSFSHPALD